MEQCEMCKGTGKQKITVHESNKPVQEMVLDCIWCNGKGQWTAEEKQRHEDYVNMWCRCEEKGESIYVPDGEGMIGKHHYICSKCFKVLQVG